MKWRFEDPENRAAFATKEVLEGRDWIQWVFRDSEDGSWQFQGTQARSEPSLASLVSIVKGDPTSLSEVLQPH